MAQVLESELFLDLFLRPEYERAVLQHYSVQGDKNREKEEERNRIVFTDFQQSTNSLR
jgi:hypothetical protein